MRRARATKPAGARTSRWPPGRPGPPGPAEGPGAGEREPRPQHAPGDGPELDEQRRREAGVQAAPEALGIHGTGGRAVGEHEPQRRNLERATVEHRTPWRRSAQGHRLPCSHRRPDQRRLLSCTRRGRCWRGDSRPATSTVRPPAGVGIDGGPYPGWRAASNRHPRTGRTAARWPTSSTGAGSPSAGSPRSRIGPTRMAIWPREGRHGDRGVFARYNGVQSGVPCPSGGPGRGRYFRPRCRSRPGGCGDDRGSKAWTTRSPRDPWAGGATCRPVFLRSETEAPGVYAPGGRGPAVTLRDARSRDHGDDSKAPQPDGRGASSCPRQPRAARWLPRGRRTARLASRAPLF